MIYLCALEFLVHQHMLTYGGSVQTPVISGAFPDMVRHLFLYICHVNFT